MFGGLGLITIGIFPNIGKKSVITKLSWILKFLKSKGVEVVLPSEAAQKAGYPELSCADDVIPTKIDIAISLGGDGTLLSTSRKVSSAGIPIFGINMGRLGFLTEVELPQISYYLEKLVNGDYYIEHRLVLDGIVVRDNKVIFVSPSLNDVVVTKAGYSRLIKLELEINKQLAAIFSADGIIVATPTGSTGYSLSAGGPIVKSDLNVILITPICPHTLYSRPLIISENEEIRIKIPTGAEDIVMTVDGQIVSNLIAGDEVFIKKSNYMAGFVKFGDKNYYQTLRNKLWRDDFDASL